MKTTIFATALGGLAADAESPDSAEAKTYMFDPSHSQIVFIHNCSGFSTGTAIFSGFEGETAFDAEGPAASSVGMSFPVSATITGWDERTKHFISAKVFDAADGSKPVSLNSTGSIVPGEDTAEITGDLTLNGIPKSITPGARLDHAGLHPVA